MDDEFAITEETSGDEIKLYVKGRVTSLNANALQYKLEEALRAGKTKMVINMMQVAILSSSGIRVLLMFYKRAKEAGGSFFVESPSENVVNVLGMVALDEMLLKP